MLIVASIQYYIEKHTCGNYSENIIYMTYFIHVILKQQNVLSWLL